MVGGRIHRDHVAVVDPRAPDPNSTTSVLTAAHSRADGADGRRLGR